MAEPPPIPEPLLIGALLRHASESVRQSVLARLAQAGFADLRRSHLAAMQYPEPDGVSPSVLAQRAGLSKQAMNAVLQSLEALGYLVREPDPRNRRTAVVRLTERGQRAFAAMRVILAEIEAEWAARLGPARFAEFKAMLHEWWQYSRNGTVETDAVRAIAGGIL